MEALGRLTGGVAHDYNNLFTVIGGNLELVATAPELTERSRTRVETIRRALSTGETLSRQLLAFARRQPLMPEPLDLRAWIGSTGELLRGAVGADIAVVRDLPDDLWPIGVDRTQFETALVNLTMNARDAMPGGGTLRFVAVNRAGVLDGGGDAVELAVSDTGAGMDDAVRARVFEPFFTTKSAGKGTGLGLSQVWGFAEQSGGRVAIDSAPGEGTTVRLLLPRARGDLAKREPSNLVPLRRGRGAVLVIDDDPDVAEAAQLLLDNAGFAATVVHGAAEALAALGTGDPRFDAVLCDIVMPGGTDGIALGRELRRRHPQLPILLVTGFSEAMATAPEFPVLAKPYSGADLVDALSRTMDGRARSAPISLPAKG
jgi:CheY-like chemotaxis protein